LGEVDVVGELAGGGHGGGCVGTVRRDRCVADRFDEKSMISWLLFPTTGTGRRMRVLGVNAIFHDPAAALVVD
jgi:hypothetical protein